MQSQSVKKCGSSAAVVAALSIWIVACAGDQPTDPGDDEGLPVVWTSVAAAPGSFDAYSCGLTAAGAAYCWGVIPGIGQSRRPIPVPGGFAFLSIGASTFRACGLTVERRAVCWAQYVAFNPPPLRPTLVDTLVFSSLSSSGSVACGLVAQRLYCLDADTSSFSPFADSGRFEAVASGPATLCALDLDGSAPCWRTVRRERRLSDADVVSGPVPFRALSVGRYLACAIATDDATYCWKLPENLSARLAVGRIETAVPGGHRFQSISVGDEYACAIAADAAAWCWGSNDSGQFGNGEIRPTANDTPVRVAGGLRFSSISAGSSTTCGVTTDGLAYCWGDANTGQVGDASPQQALSVFEKRLFPTRVANPLR